MGKVCCRNIVTDAQALEPEETFKQDPDWRTSRMRKATLWMAVFGLVGLVWAAEAAQTTLTNFKCPICAKDFSTFDQLKSHFATAHSPGSVLPADDPFVGTWKMNVAKSKASVPGMLPKSETSKGEAQGDIYKWTFDGVDAQGKAYHVEWSGKSDGKDYPVTGNPTTDMSSGKQIDANTLMSVRKKAGKEAGTFRVTVSKDGKVLTAAGKGKDEKGQEWSLTAVYDKQ
jgi:hypothetical protein